MINGSPPLPLRIRASSRSAIEVMSADGTAVRPRHTWPGAVTLSRMRYVLIMAGGSGKRLWPLSRQGMPKQLLKVVGGKSLLRTSDWTTSSHPSRC